jgi:hypothetical protein
VIEHRSAASGSFRSATSETDAVVRRDGDVGVEIEGVDVRAARMLNRRDSTGATVGEAVPQRVAARRISR